MAKESQPNNRYTVGDCKKRVYQHEPVQGTFHPIFDDMYQISIAEDNQDQWYPCYHLHQNTCFCLKEMFNIVDCNDTDICRSNWNVPNHDEIWTNSIGNLYSVLIVFQYRASNYSLLQFSQWHLGVHNLTSTKKKLTSNLDFFSRNSDLTTTNISNYIHLKLGYISLLVFQNSSLTCRGTCHVPAVLDLQFSSIFQFLLYGT